MPERRPRAGARLTRRAAAQWPLLAAVLAALVVCSALVGVGALLLTDGQHRALAAAISAADGPNGSGSADLVTATIELDPPAAGEPENTRTLLAGVAATMSEALRPYAATSSTWAASPMLYLPGDDPRLGYLLDADSASEHASLASGRWPTTAAAGAPVEVAIPTTTAAALDLAVGSRLRLTATPAHPDAAPPAGQDVVVVGLVTPDGTSTWDRDVLAGTGVNSQWSRLPAYGPFLTAPGTLIAADAPVGHVSVVVDPNLSGDPDGLPTVARAIDGLGAAVTTALAGRGGAVLVRSDLPAVISADRAEQNITAAIVLIVMLLVAALGVATLGLIGQLLVQRRTSEGALLAERGASRRQLAGRAAAESLILAALAIAAGVPLALLGYRWMVSARPLGPAWAPASGLVERPGLTTPLVLAVSLAACGFAAVLVFAAMRDHRSHGRRRLNNGVARSGADLLLAGVAVLGFLQLRAHRVGTDSIDPVLVVAPVLCLVAGAALALRALPVVARVAEIRARRGTGVVMPLAGWQVARGRATSGAFLTVLAAAAATFGITFLGTWSVAQQDQADASLGADLVVGERGGPETATKLAAITRGIVAPVTTRAVSLGSRPGGAEIVALDTLQAGDLVRGRLPGGESWSSVTEGLAPSDAIAGLTVSGADQATVRLVMTGTFTAPSLEGPNGMSGRVLLTPTVVLADAWGNRVALEGAPVPADGKPHDVDVPAAGHDRLPAGEWSVIAVDLRLGLVVAGGIPTDPTALGAVKVDIDVPGAKAGPGQWDARAVGQQPPLKPLSTVVTGTTVTATVGVWITGLVWEESHVVLVGFTPVDELPVVVSDQAASELGLAPGDPVTITVGITTIHGRVLGSTPYVPSAPRGAVVLVDSDALSRAMLTQGELGSLTDAWWVANPRVGSAAALEAVGLAPVETRADTAERLRAGPLRVALRAALGLLVAAAVVLAIAGTAAHATAISQTRGVEFARLRGVGVARRELLATGVLQHLAVMSATVVVGAALGEFFSRVIGPLLVVGEGGLLAVPAPRFIGEWVPLAAVLLALLVAGFAVGVPAVRSLVGRATSVGLRMGDAS